MVGGLNATEVEGASSTLRPGLRRTAVGRRPALHGERDEEHEREDRGADRMARFLDMVTASPPHR